MGDFVGEYQNTSVGRVAIRKEGLAYYMKTDRWESLLGSIKLDGGEKALALVSPPWSGTVALSVKRGPVRTLIFDDDVSFTEAK